MNAKGFTLDTNIITALIKKDERIKSKINEAYEKIYV
jgi:predicted nucleic-acid-binding protein